MGCECSQGEDEAGTQIVNSNVEAAKATVKPPQFSSDETMKVSAASTQPRVSVKPVAAAPTTGGSDSAWFCKRGANGDLVKVTKAADGKKVIHRQDAVHNNEHWVSVQVGERIFQVSEGAQTNFRWTYPDGSGETEVRPVPKSAGSYFSLANFNDSSVFIVGGGADQRSTISAHGKVQRYVIDSDEWQTYPDLVVARQGAASAVMDNTLYVFGGQRADATALNSIEYLTSLPIPGNHAAYQWQIIEIDEKKFYPRWFPCVCVLNQNEVAVLGGMGNIDDEYSLLGDVVIFNSQTQDCSTVVKNFPGLLQFQGMGNNCALLGDKVVAIVENDMNDDSVQTLVVEWGKGDKRFKKIKEL